MSRKSGLLRNSVKSVWGSMYTSTDEPSFFAAKALAISPDGRFCSVPEAYEFDIWTNRWYYALQIYETDSGKSVSSLRERSRTLVQTHCSLSGDGAIAAVGYEGGRFALWNAQTGHHIWKCDAFALEKDGESGFGTLLGLDITANGRTVIGAGGNDFEGELRFYDTEIGSCTEKFACCHRMGQTTNTADFAAFGRNGLLVYTLDRGSKTIGLIDRRCLKPVFSRRYTTSSFFGRKRSDEAEFSGGSNPGAVVTDRDGTIFVISYPINDEVHLWDSRKQRPLSIIRYGKTTKRRPGSSNQIFRSGRTSMTAEGSALMASDCLCDLRTRRTIPLAEDHEHGLVRNFEAVSGVMSADGQKAIVVSVLERKHEMKCKTHASGVSFFEAYDQPFKLRVSNCNLGVSRSRMLGSDIGPRGSVVSLGSEVQRMYINYMNHARLPSKADLICALTLSGRAYAVKSMTDIFCAHVFIRTLDDKGIRISDNDFCDESVQTFFWRCVYMKMTAAAKGGEERELGRQIVIDAKQHGFVDESGVRVLLMGLRIGKHIDEKITGMTSVMRDIKRNLTGRVEDLEDALCEVRRAREVGQKVVWAKFGLSLVPVVGGACSAFIGVTESIFLSLEAEHLLNFLKGNFHSLASLVMDFQGTEAVAEARLAAVVYSEEFEELLGSRSSLRTKDQLEALSKAAFGSTEALWIALRREMQPVKEIR